jgi:hypothetical protein
LPELPLNKPKKKDIDSFIAPYARSSVDSIIPKPGVIIVDRGYNRKSDLNVSQAYGQMTREQYKTQVSGRIVHFLPAIKDARTSVMNEKDEEYYEHNKELSIELSDSKFEHTIKRNANFNLNELSTNREILDGESSPSIRKEKVRNRRAGSVDFDMGMDSIDKFNNAILSNRNWGNDEGISSTFTKTSPKCVSQSKRMKLKRVV